MMLFEKAKKGLENIKENFDYYSTLLVGKQKKRLLALLPLIAPIYVAAQNIKVSGHIQIIPDMTNAQSGIHMKNLLTNQTYSTFTDSSGNFNQTIPAGRYFRTIQTIGCRRFEDTLDVRADTVLNEQMIKPRKALSTYFTDDLDVANCLVDQYGSQGTPRFFRWNDVHVPIRFSTDTTFPMPIGTPHRERLDTALTDLLEKSHGSAKFREAVDDSVVNVLFQYKPRSQIPGRNSGWTIIDDLFLDLTPKHMTVLIANDQPYVSVGTFARELARVLRLFNTVPDRTFVMFINYAAQRFHPDEGNAIELIYKLKIRTDTRKYKNIVDTTLTRIKDILNNKPKDFKLYQNYPNPFNASTIISFALPGESHVHLSLFNTFGQKVATLINEKREEGIHAATLDGSNLSSGVYFYRLSTGNFTQTRKLMLLK